MKNSLQLCWMKHISLFYSSILWLSKLQWGSRVVKWNCLSNMQNSILMKRLNDYKTRSLSNHSKIKSNNKKVWFTREALRLCCRMFEKVGKWKKKHNLWYMSKFKTLSWCINWSLSLQNQNVSKYNKKVLTFHLLTAVLSLVYSLFSCHSVKFWINGAKQYLPWWWRVFRFSTFVFTAHYPYLQYVKSVIWQDSNALQFTSLETVLVLYPYLVLSNH